MKQIKKKIDKDATYSLPTFKSEMHLLWDNARTYNQEGSWVYEAADQMQEEFDRLYDIEIASIAARTANSGSGSGGPSQVASGTSTPMFKAAGVGKIKLNLGSKLKAQAAQSVASGTGSLTGEDSGDDDEDEDDDY